jgi:predicted RNase H-like HicB family nuclease
LKVAAAIRLIERDGWYQAAQRGSHRQFKHASKLGAGHPQQHIEAGRPEREIVMRYAVVIERAEANYSAYVPDLPGCIATGDTVPAVEHEIREAIRFHIEGLRADGLPVPAPSAIAEYVEA